MNDEEVSGGVVGLTAGAEKGRTVDGSKLVVNCSEHFELKVVAGGERIDPGEVELDGLGVVAVVVNAASMTVATTASTSTSPTAPADSVRPV